MKSNLIDIQPYQVRGWTRTYEAAIDLAKEFVTIVWRSLLAEKTWNSNDYKLKKKVLTSPLHHV